MTQTKTLRTAIRTMLESIVVNEMEQEELMNVSDAGYINQRALISSLFDGPYDRGRIMLRLTVIDSLYSTNAGYSYFSFEQMADEIYALGDSEKTADGKRKAARDYFARVALTGKDPKDLFGKAYGYQKNLALGTKQMSLLSKYAYYELMQKPEDYPVGFPIYDRLAKMAYPTVRKMLGEADYYSMPELETPSMLKYVTCLTQLRKALFDDDKLFRAKGSKRGYQQFDILDAYLWRMGKFTDGNMSLLLGRKDYEKFITNLGFESPIDKKSGERHDTESYREHMAKEFDKAFPKLKEMKSNPYTLDDLILHHFTTDTASPFKGLTEEKYLDELFEHWKLFNLYASKEPHRGIAFKE